jgi:CDK inhibitor PHO81
MVPALVESIKVAGLVLVSDTTFEAHESSGAEEQQSQQQHPLVYSQYSMGSDRIDGVDGLLRENGVLRFNETIDM